MLVATCYNWRDFFFRLVSINVLGFNDPDKLKHQHFVLLMQCIYTHRQQLVISLSVNQFNKYISVCNMNARSVRMMALSKKLELLTQKSLQNYLPYSVCVTKHQFCVRHIQNKLWSIQRELFYSTCRYLHVIISFIGI